MKKNSIALILPYFGKLPPYFGLFLKGLEGKHLDVLFFSDIEVGAHPENFKVIKMTFDEFRRLAGERLGVPVTMNGPKRLCDFRPMYGLILEDFLGEYEYIGWGDCDAVYGNKLNEFLDAMPASGFDVISSRKHWCSGPFLFTRNCAEVNNLFRKADNWKEIVDSKITDIEFFDEIGCALHPLLERGEMTIDDCRAIRDNYSALVWRSPELKFKHEDFITECGLVGRAVTMEPDGRLLLDGDEISVFHYIGVKTRRYFEWAKVPYERASGFVIDDAGFYVTARERRWRWLINRWRKLKAVFASLRQNGFKRIAVVLGLRKNCK